MTRLLLVRHVPTAATRRAAFPGDEPLDGRGRQDATRLAGRLPAVARVLSAPARRCRETARAAGLAEPVIEPRLAECDFGGWAGRTLGEIHAETPDALAAWMTDPAAAPPGGESLADLLTRVGDWLRERLGDEGTTVAVTHGGVVKAAVTTVLQAPSVAFWRIDVGPGSITDLRARDGRWILCGLNATAEADG